MEVLKKYVGQRRHAGGWHKLVECMGSGMLAPCGLYSPFMRACGASRGGG